MGLIKLLEVPSSTADGRQSTLDNADLRPIPKADRKWGFWTW